MKKCSINGAVFFLESAVYSGKSLVMLSGIARNETMCKAAVASLHNSVVRDCSDAENVRALHGYTTFDAEPFFGFYTKQRVEKDSFTHFAAFKGNFHFKGNNTNNPRARSRYKSVSYLCTKDNEAEILFNLLMKEFKYPLMRDWMNPIIDYWNNGGLRDFYKPTSVIKGCEEDQTVNIGGEKVVVSELIARDFLIEEGQIESTIKTLFQRGVICISKKPQRKVEAENLDQYIERYGTSVIDNLDKVIIPEMPNVPNIDCVALEKMRLFPQQICKVNGGINSFLHGTKSLFIIMGCGTGKTIQTASIAEGYFNKKYMSLHNADLKEACDSVVYRHIVMCPGHLVNKWANELRTQIPNAKVTVITKFEQLIKLLKHGPKRDGKEWYIMSKDFSKLSNQSIPTPFKVGKKKIKARSCAECGVESIKSKCHCGSTKFVIKEVDRLGEGLLCPNCKEILMPYKNGIRFEADRNDIEDFPLGPASFLGPNAANSRCHLCGEELWQPNVHKINVGGDMAEIAKRHTKSPWVRVKHYSNKAHKNTKMVWVHKEYVSQYLKDIGEDALSISEDVTTARKYSPAQFIKKKLKGYFDFFIADEAHQYKSQGSAQANAFTAILSASKKSMLLSGTIIGGYATDLFGLLYRTYPGLMKNMGFEWQDAMKFATKYGVIAKEFEYIDNSNARYNVSSRGRQLGTPKVKPGVSPLVFVDFLLDKALFLDLSDMSAFMPALTEQVVLTPLEDEIKKSYGDVLDRLKAAAKTSEGRTILSRLLQFSLSYSDKPYGVLPIVSSITGAILTNVPDNSHLIANGQLLNKEAKLVELVNEELKQGRRCLVFCEYTGSNETIITPRIKDILEKHCGLKGQVLLLEASSPKASEREAYIRKSVEATDAKVLLCNPRLIETGLDAVWNTDFGETISFSTIIFYQLGYSLFTLFQASRRHYRLNQRSDCKTYYMASENTLQGAVISIMAEKEMAMTTLQGSSSFSSESLASMAAGTDAKQKLMEALAKNDLHNANELQQMFDVVNNEHNANKNIDIEGFEKMLLYSELTRVAEAIESIDSISDAEEQANTLAEDTYDAFLSVMNMIMPKALSEKQQKKFEKKNPDQASLLDFLTF